MTMTACMTLLEAIDSPWEADLQGRILQELQVQLEDRPCFVPSCVLARLARLQQPHGRVFGRNVAKELRKELLACVEQGQGRWVDN
jgi:hypothetical protein